MVPPPRGWSTAAVVGGLVGGSGVDGEEGTVLVPCSEVLVRRLVAGVVCSVVAVVCSVVAVVWPVVAVVWPVVAGKVVGVDDGALIDEGALLAGTVTDPRGFLGGTVTVVVLSVADGPGVLTAGTEGPDDDGADDPEASPAAPPRLGTVTVGRLTGGRTRAVADAVLAGAVLAGAGGLGSAVLAVPQAATASAATHSTAVVDERNRRRARIGPQCQAKGPRPRQHVEDRSTSRLE